MRCCKSNDAVAVRGAPSPTLKNKPSSSNYGAFLTEVPEQKFEEPPQISSSTISFSEDVTAIYGDPTKSKSFDRSATGANTGNGAANTSPEKPRADSPAAPVPAPPLVLACSSDDITTVYEEPPKVPENAYVLLPDFPQRGYEPSRSVSYGTKDAWKEMRPYRIGTLVWYRNTTNTDERSRKFNWYIPGEIDDLIFSTTDKNEVIAYKIKIDTEDLVVPEIDPYYLNLLSNAKPQDVMLRWNGKVPPCPVDGIHEVSVGNTADRVSKLLEECGDDLGFRGAKQNGVGPHQWGITLEQLEEIMSDPKFNNEMSMYDVIENIVKPKTAGTGIGYALYLNKDKPLQAKVMVSHAWGENFTEFFSALRQSGNQGPFWICALAIYQNEDIDDVTIEKQLGSDPHFGPFSTVLKQADSMIAIMTSSCDIYTRLWCVYEIFVAISLNIPVTLQSYNEITGYGGSDKMYSNVVLDSTGRAVTTKDAECAFEKDKKMIYREIMKEDGGFGLIDDVVMWVRIKALIDDLPNCERKSQTQTQLNVPIGTCTATNIVARQNAGIANAIRVWQQAKSQRKKNKENLPIPKRLPSFKEIFSGTKDEPKIRTKSIDDETYGYFSVIRDKLCCEDPKNYL